MCFLVRMFLHSGFFLIFNTKFMWVVIYFIGAVLSYVLYRYDIKKTFGSFTVADRTLSLVCSLFSWILVILALAMIFRRFLGNLDIDWDKESKW